MSYGQVPDSLSLDYCIQNAVRNYPLSRQKTMFSDINDLKIHNLRKAYLPQININGQATYQSDVTEIPISLPSFNLPTIDKDSYKATIDVSQLIYDGGMNRNQEKIENATCRVDLQNVEIELYKLRERINQIYFNVLMLNENARQVVLVQEELRSKLAKTESAVRNGISVQSSYDILKAEMLKTEMQLIDILYANKEGINMLEVLTGLVIPDSVKLVEPETKQVNVPENKRPEMKQFGFQSQKTESLKKLVTAKYLPKLSGFGQFGYGKPGLNMLSDEFDRFYLVGLKLTWSPWNWNHDKNEINIIETQNELIKTQSETFDKNQKAAIDKELSEIEKYTRLISIDNEVIITRESILKTSSSQFDNGIITVSDYLTDLNNLSQARLNLNIRKIHLSRTKINLLNLSGMQQ